MPMEALLPSLEISVAFNVDANELLSMNKIKQKREKCKKNYLSHNNTGYCAYFTSVCVIMGLLVHS